MFKVFVHGSKMGCQWIHKIGHIHYFSLIGGRHLFVGICYIANCNWSVPPQSNPLLKSHLFVGSRSLVCFNYLVVYGRILKTCGPYPISRTRPQLIFLLVKHPISVDQLHLAG